MERTNQSVGPAVEEKHGPVWCPLTQLPPAAGTEAWLGATSAGPQAAARWVAAVPALPSGKEPKFRVEAIWLESKWLDAKWLESKWHGDGTSAQQAAPVHSDEKGLCVHGAHTCNLEPARWQTWLAAKSHCSHKTAGAVTDNAGDHAGGSDNDGA